VTGPTRRTPMRSFSLGFAAFVTTAVLLYVDAAASFV
jgi:hypothetical protein